MAIIVRSQEFPPKIIRKNTHTTNHYTSAFSLIESKERKKKLRQVKNGSLLKGGSNLIGVGMTLPANSSS